MLDPSLLLQISVHHQSLLGSGKRLRDFRNEIQHLEEHLVDGKIGEDQNIALRLEQGSFCVGKYSISYAEYAQWLQQLHLCVAHFVSKNTLP